MRWFSKHPLVGLCAFLFSEFPWSEIVMYIDMFSINNTNIGIEKKPCLSSLVGAWTRAICWAFWTVSLVELASKTCTVYILSYSPKSEMPYLKCQWFWVHGGPPWSAMVSWFKIYLTMWFWHLTFLGEGYTLAIRWVKDEYPRNPDSAPWKVRAASAKGVKMRRLGMRLMNGT